MIRGTGALQWPDLSVHAVSIKLGERRDTRTVLSLHFPILAQSH